MSHIATADPLWPMQSTHSSSVPGGAWLVAREGVGRAVGAQLTPDTMVSLMLQSEQIWMLIESFVTLVLKTRELDSRNRIGACTRGPASSADLAVRECWGKNLLIPPLVGAASRPA